MSKFSDLQISAKLNQFFPPEDPDSIWLFRLMFLHDDISFEFYNLPLSKDANNDAVWRNTYFQRRLSVSLSEVAGIFEYNMGSLIKKTESPYLKEFSPYLHGAIKEMKAAMEHIKPFRDSIGGHFRPQNLDPKGECVMSRAMKSYPNLEGVVRVGINNLRDSSYRTLTSNSPLLTSPDAKSEEELEEHQIGFRDAVMRAAPESLAAIDALLVWFWIKNGVYTSPDGMALAIVDQETGAMKPLPSAV